MKEIKKENVREVTVPLTVEQIKEFFVNKELLYFVDYKRSDLKGVVFLTYLSNLDLPAEINFKDSTYEEREELFKIYMTTRNIIPSETLRLNTANIILKYRGVDADNFIVNSSFSDDEIIKFIENNNDVLEKWETFTESTTIFAQSTIEALVDTIKIEESIEQVVDHQYIGANVVNLFSIPSFYELFLTVPYRHELKYFKHQFEDYMFRGKNFYSYYNCAENNVYHLFKVHLNGKTSIKEIYQAAAVGREQVQALKDNADTREIDG